VFYNSTKIPLISIIMDMSQLFCDVFIAYYIIAISNLHKRTPSIALYGILFEKSQESYVGQYFLYIQINHDPIISICLW